MLRPLILLAFLVAASTTKAQWQLHDAHTTADLRGIDNVGNGVAWASGTDGTILRTEDAGFVWQLCAKPPGGEHLDFRAIQAFDNNTAIIMSSGKGDLSRLYKTTDGCQTWKLLFTNPDPDGFWDALKFNSPNHGFLLGDPMRSPGDTKPNYFLSETKDGGVTWQSWHDRPDALRAYREASVFAASNSSMLIQDPGQDHGVLFGTGGYVSLVSISRGPGGGVCNCSPMPPKLPPNSAATGFTPIPLTAGDTAGIFSIAVDHRVVVMVGGDYKQPNSSNRTAAFSGERGGYYEATTQPHGYRSAVAYDASTDTWITVGPNGTDISTDDGRNWRPLKPDPAFNDTPDADQHWNTLSLPYVVGPHGRIATLRPSALEAAHP
jgi:hypothetical protein